MATSERLDGPSTYRSRLGVNDAQLRGMQRAVPALLAIGDRASPRRPTHAVLDANIALRRFDEAA
jgi:hypothetical protein